MDTTTLTAATITDDQIAALSIEADVAGDTEMVTICREALDGVSASKAECAKVINAARAMDDSE